MRNLITDVAGVRVGSAQDERLASGATVVLFDEPAVGAICTPGGAPALRDGLLLRPEMTVERIDGFALSGGSAFGLDASGGAMSYLRSIGRGFEYAGVRVPIVPGAALFDLSHGGDKAWGRVSPYGELGFAATEAAARDFDLGAVGAGYGAWTCDFKGGLGSASAVSSSGFTVGALAAVNAAGRVTRGGGAHFWAASYERDGEFGGLGEGPRADDAFTLALSADDPVNTTLVVVATDAALDKAQATRLAIMASGGFALAIRPAFGPIDGDVLFAAATRRARRPATIRDLTDIGALAAECVARAIARGVYEAEPLALMPRKPSWKQTFGES